jgi:membrane protein implicated in regulation of membrane protease activity
MRRFVSWIFIVIVGSICLLAPLLAAFFSIKNKRWILAALSIASWFVLRKILFVVENKIGIRSLQNPEARTHGAGITFVASWLRRKIDRTEDCNEKID